MSIRNLRALTCVGTVICYASLSFCIVMLPFDIAQHHWPVAVLRFLALVVNAIAVARVIPRMWRSLREIEDMERMQADIERRMRMLKRHEVN